MTRCAVSTGLLGVTNALALLRLLPMSDRDKDTEMLALRHQITVLERQLGSEKVGFTRADRAWLAALLHRLPRDVLRGIRLLIRPETVLRWHRDLIAYRHARISRPKQAGRPVRGILRGAGASRGELVTAGWLGTMTVPSWRLRRPTNGKVIGRYDAVVWIAGTRASRLRRS